MFPGSQPSDTTFCTLTECYLEVTENKHVLSITPVYCRVTPKSGGVGNTNCFSRGYPTPLGPGSSLLFQQA